MVLNYRTIYPYNCTSIDGNFCLWTFSYNRMTIIAFYNAFIKDKLPLVLYGYTSSYSASNNGIVLIFSIFTINYVQ